MYIKKNDQKKIKTIFYTKTQIIKEYWFKITSTLKDIFNYFEKHIKDEGYSLKPNYRIFSKKINEYCTISELIKKENNDMVLEGEIWIEVEEEIYFDDENDETFHTILQPKINPFELIEYNPIKSKINIIQCPKDIYNYCNLNKFTKESAFCNSSNSLYMSGGEISGRAHDFFWIINKNNYKITKKNMPITKKYHSMLYIPDNFIFVAGGDSLDTIIYDIENQEFIKWANMNKKHFQPGLYIYGDYIYAFSALKDKRESSNFFEKTNLTSKTPKWEKVFPKYDNNLIMFNNHFFGLSKCSDGNILFVGGEKNNPNYLYNPMDNKIFLSTGDNINIPFWDKSFYKISKQYNACIPLDFSTNYQMAFLDKETESLNEVKCSKSSGLINFNIEKEKSPGNIFIQSTIKKPNCRQKITIQMGLNPKKLRNSVKNECIYESNSNEESDNNDSDSENINFEEERIILEENNNIIQNNDDLNKNYEKKKSYLYVPDSVIDEQIIAREVDLDGKKEKENNSNNNLEEKIDDNNNNNNYNEADEDDDITKEEYIFIGNLNGSNDKDIIKTRSPKNKQFLYISNSVIDDQIINRELQLNNNKNDNKNDIKNENKIDNKIDNKSDNKSDNKMKSNKKSKKYNVDEEIPEIKIMTKEEEEEDEEDDEEDKLIINYENENIESNVIPKVKPYNKNYYLYIPYSSIDDQIVDREVDININDDDDDNDDDNGKNNKNVKSLTRGENSKPYIKKKIDNKNTAISGKCYGRNTFSFNKKSDNEMIKEKENEIVNHYESNKEEPKVKRYKIEKKIFIPEYAIEDQIIKREVISDINTTI
jgi:hypothetical protein